MKTSLLTMLFVAATIPMVTSCKKGDTGPAGTANVMYSPWLTPFGNKDSIIDGSQLKVQYITADSLTTEKLNSGVTVLVYLNYSSNTIPLPYTSSAGGKTSTLSFVPRAGSIVITRFTHDNTASVGLGTNKYRFVIIPGGVQTNSVSTKAIPVGIKPDLYSTDTRYPTISYDEVTSMFRIPK